MKLLLVDDDRLALRTLKAYATRLGYEVLTAGDGHEGLALWRAESPSIVVTDWMMPEMDGLELVQNIRSEEAGDYTFVLMATERSDVKDLISGFEAGVDDYLIKPIHRDELTVRLKASERVLAIQNKDVVIFALAKLSEAKDSDTGFHLERIRNYCRVLCEYLLQAATFPTELTRIFVNNIYLTSPLHDIGKVGIPDHILLKPARLDDAEFTIMKAHTLIGYETLVSAFQKERKAAYLKMAADIARYHHEKWDGTGYPDGLKGDDIPLAARVLAVADVYDALVSKRAYKDAFSHIIARSIILKGSGTHFDPRLVEAFLACERDIQLIHSAFTSVNDPGV